MVAYRYRVLAAGMISLLCLPVFAGDKDADRARALVERGEIQSLKALRAQHGERLSGRLLEVELEKKHHRWRYELEILGDDGVVREIRLDARTGEWLSEEIEK